VTLAERAVLVTGGAGGLGAAMAETLRAAGARVYILDVTADRGHAVAERVNARGRGHPVRFVEADLREPATLRDRVAALGAEDGGFDGLVNNAAVVPLKPIADYGLVE
jgi:NAD(P)-dependent dehydrogenase (short-subunit alcohol dehydrogenase family)